MRKLSLVVLALFFAISLQANSCGSNKSSNYKMNEALWSLDLNEDQEGKLDAIIKNHRKSMIDLEGDLMESKRLAGFGKDKFDRKEFVKTKEDPFVKMIKARADLFEKIHAVLSPAQREAFAASFTSCNSNKRGSGANKKSCNQNNKRGKQ